MTRSDDPFGDLPEWKERQRLQEAQGHGGGQSGQYQPHSQDQRYAQPAQPHHQQHIEPTLAHQTGNPQAYDKGNQQYAAPPMSSYQEPAPSQLHYNVHQADQQSQFDAQQYRHQQQLPPEPGQGAVYDPQTQVTYPANPGGQHPGQYPDDAHLQPAYDPGHGTPARDQFGLRDGQYDDRGQFGMVPGGFEQAGQPQVTLATT